MRLVNVDDLDYDRQLESMGDGQYEYVDIAYRSDIDALPTVNVEKVIRKAAKKLAYIHERIDLYGDRDDLHSEEYWYEYLLDEEWHDPDITDVSVDDAVPVIQCKDCKYWGEDPYKNGCKYMTYIVCENDYCSNAERKEQ